MSYLNGLGSPGGSDGKESASYAGDPSPSLGQEDPLEKEMATHSGILAWKIPWTEEPDGLQSIESQSWTQLSGFTFTCIPECLVVFPIVFNVSLNKGENEHFQIFPELLFSRACLRGKLFYQNVSNFVFNQSLIDLVEMKYPARALSSLPAPPMRMDWGWRSTYESHSPGSQAHWKLRPHHRAGEHFPSLSISPPHQSGSCITTWDYSQAR